MLTAFALGFINVTLARMHASVLLVVLDGALEKAFATFAGQDSVVVSRNL